MRKIKIAVKRISYTRSNSSDEKNIFYDSFQYTFFSFHDIHEFVKFSAVGLSRSHDSFNVMPRLVLNMKNKLCSFGVGMCINTERSRIYNRVYTQDVIYGEFSLIFFEFFLMASFGFLAVLEFR